MIMHTNMQLTFLIYTKFYSQKNEWDWAAGIDYFSPLLRALN